MSNLVLRLTTAGLLIPVLLSVLFLDPTHWGVLILSSVVAVLASDEFVRMGLGKDAQSGVILRVAAGICSATLVGLVGWNGINSMPAVLIGATIFIGLIALFRREHIAQAGRDFSLALSSFLYIPTLVCVWPLIKLQGGANWLTIVLATAFLSDSVAYFAGRAFGKHRLYPEVSPNKTVEGAIGGIVGGVLAQVGAGSFWLLPDLPVQHAVVLGIAGSVLGQCGDLVESMLKRSFGVKDSGQVLPGHGGMLDRIDALLFVAPLIYGYQVVTNINNY